MLLVGLTATDQVYHVMELILTTFILKVTFCLFTQWTANLRKIRLVPSRVSFNVVENTVASEGAEPLLSFYT